MVESGISQNDFKKHVRNKYSERLKNEDEQFMDSIYDFIISNQEKRASLDSFLEDLVKLIQHKFHFREVAIGIIDRSDGMYMYRIIRGLSKKATTNLMGRVYSYDDLADSIKYPYWEFAKNFEMCSALGEDEEEWETFTRPSYIKEPRKSIDDFIESDYLHIDLCLEKDELIGWIELGRPFDGKLPSRRKIKWLELLGGIVTRIIWEKEFAKSE